LNKKIYPKNLTFQPLHTKKIPNIKKDPTPKSNLRTNPTSKKKKTKNNPPRKKTKNNAVPAPVPIPPVQALLQTPLPLQALKIPEKEEETEKNEIQGKTTRETDDQSQKAEKKENNPERNPDTILEESHGMNAGTQEMKTEAGTRSEATTAAAEAGTTKATADDDCITLN
jgi:hypothetical protein